MTGRWGFIGQGVLALALVGFAAACGADDDDDDLPAAGVGGASGSSGASGASGAGGSSGAGGAAGSAGSVAMVTPATCAANSKMESTVTLPACIDCVCAKNAAVIDKVGAPGWRLIECIGEKCDGVGTDADCILAPPPDGCMNLVAAGSAEATTTAAIFPMCMTECGIGDMPDADGGI
jgi:hypothetical protein